MDIIEIGKLIAKDMDKLPPKEARKFRAAYHRLKRIRDKAGDMGLGALLLLASQECAKYGE
jgi:hypothetical protein